MNLYFHSGYQTFVPPEYWTPYEENAIESLANLAYSEETVEQTKKQEPSIKMTESLANWTSSEETCEERFDKLNKNYFSILNGGSFVEMDEQYRFKIADVDQDCYLVLPVTKQNFSIGTSGIRTCIAVCAVGRDRLNNFVLGLAHQSTCDPEETLDLLMKELKTKGCVEEKTEIYLIGGVIEENNDCIDSMEKFLHLSNKYPIKGARFNLLEPLEEEDYADPYCYIETLSIVLTESKVLFSLRSNFFNAIEGQESAGKPIY